MKVGCIIQARTGSTRFPDKVLQEILGVPLLLRVIERVSKSNKIATIIVATSDLERDNRIISLIENNNKFLKRKLEYYRGSEEDVLDRYYQAAKNFKLDIIVRANSDNPLQDYRIIDRLIARFKKDRQLDYATTRIEKRTWPFGMDAEVFSFAALKRSWESAKLPQEREHVTLYMRKHPEIFRIFEWISKQDLSDIRLSVDLPDDLHIVRGIYAALYKKKPDFSLTDILNHLGRN